MAKGFQQQIGINYDETFSPVVRFESVRAVLALSAQHGLKVHQMDVSSAFLNGDLSEEIYMSQPPGFIENENMVCKLNKSIYGLKQAPKCWNASLDNYLKNQKFVRSSSDSCVYTKVDGDVCIVAVYVDDIIIACKSVERIRDIKSSLSSRYKMKDLGELSYFLGVNVIQNCGNIFINQAQYSKSILEKYQFNNANAVSTPVDVSSVLDNATDDCELFDKENSARYYLRCL